ncbi:MAG TPA: hypothetical protein VGB26_08985 [Nitrospiria bacterium]|jgi:protein subunit release factor A
MNKVKAKKPKENHKKIKDPFALGKEIDQLAAVIVDIEEEMETVSRESSPLEDIEGAKAHAAKALDKYTALMKKLGKEKRGEIRQMFKPGLDHIKNKLTHLKEAPE